MTRTPRRLLTFALATLTLLAAFGATAVAAPTPRRVPIRIKPPAPPPVADVDSPIGRLLHAALDERRTQQIARLRKYLELGIFPRNRVADGVVNIFRDADGLLCAIAYLVNADGLLALVEDTATNNNQVQIGTLKSGPLLDWVLSSGFTQEEIAYIQLPDSHVGMGGQEWFIGENKRIRAHMATALARLERDKARSLALATSRLMAKINIGV